MTIIRPMEHCLRFHSLTQAATAVLLLSLAGCSGPASKSAPSLAKSGNAMGCNAGSPDPSFAQQGRLLVDFDDVNTTPSSDNGLQVFCASGINNSGCHHLCQGAPSAGTDMARDNNNRYVAVGYANCDTRRYVAVRIDSKGELDPEFGQGGKVVDLQLGDYDYSQANGGSHRFERQRDYRWHLWLR